MHTKGKWVIRPDTSWEVRTLFIFSEKRKSKGEYPYHICMLSSFNPDSDDNAERIVQMHNSFDELLEALKQLNKLAILTEAIAFSPEVVNANLAIAKAEGN